MVREEKEKEGESSERAINIGTIGCNGDDQKPFHRLRPVERCTGGPGPGRYDAPGP
ncbi:unnamed protein product, partial [Rotaria magnacalcarata]